MINLDEETLHSKPASRKELVEGLASVLSDSDKQLSITHIAIVGTNSPFLLKENKNKRELNLDQFYLLNNNCLEVVGENSVFVLENEEAQRKVVNTYRKVFRTLTGKLSESVIIKIENKRRGIEDGQYCRLNSFLGFFSYITRKRLLIELFSINEKQLINNFEDFATYKSLNDDVGCEFIVNLTRFLLLTGAEMKRVIPYFVDEINSMGNHFCGLRIDLNTFCFHNDVYYIERLINLLEIIKRIDIQRCRLLVKFDKDYQEEVFIYRLLEEIIENCQSKRKVH